MRGISPWAITHIRFDGRNRRCVLRTGLCTDAGGIPAQLDPIDFEVGVIAGTRTVNFMLSQYLPNPDDGKVTVESTKVEGMKDFIALPHSHSFIMKKPATIDQAITFISTGSFVHEIE